MFNFVKKNFFLIGLVFFFLVVLAVNIRINAFRYDNFDYGKFDLGNMSQMVWNTLDGRFMYLTDYFGTNLPRWAMSHVDPILLLFVPLFAAIPHPMTLVYAQVLLVLVSAFLVYAIAKLELGSKLAAAAFGASFLAYPAVGFVTAWTGYHGVSVVIPFFLGAFYVFEKMHKAGNFTKKGLVTFWILLTLTMMGKEQLPLYICFYGLFILLFRNPAIESLTFSKEWLVRFLKTPISRLSLWMMGIGFAWFFTAFFIIIPAFADYRVEGYEEFAKSLGLMDNTVRDVALPNYFLARYDAFGESYTEIMLNILFRPSLATEVFFGGDRVENLVKTFGPLAYAPLAYPPLLMISLPDFLINYMTSAGGIGTAEVRNHRISMIIPVLFLASIYAISFLYLYLRPLLEKVRIRKELFVAVLALAIFGSNIYMSFYDNNPVYLWMAQAIKKRVFAKTESEIAKKDLEIGEVVRISELEDKDRDCARNIVSMIPDGVSVSGPDYLGAHLSLRETYAIFPALYNEADYVVVDIFSKKILTILDADLDLGRQVVERIMRSEDYRLVWGCGNLFVFQNVGPHEKDPLMPLQERYQYEETTDLEFFQDLHIVDYSVPAAMTRGVPSSLKFVHVPKENSALSDYVMFTSFLNTETGHLYQSANLPSFGVIQPEDWVKDRYYVENLSMALPEFLDEGVYKVFLGMGNKIRTRSIYLGDVEVL
jgi:uncharacterized membrane protein